MKIKVIILLMALFMVSGALPVIEPASAVQNGDLIDHGTKYTTSAAKCDWKTYKLGENEIKIDKSFYYKENGNWVYDFKYAVTLQKISPTKIKIGQEDAWGINYYYEDTPLSTNNYYWNIYRHEWLEN
jgi:hypothetical protein